jgi:hypothetical protein
LKNGIIAPPRLRPRASSRPPGHPLPRREAFLAARADAGERRSELAQALEVVHRAEIVDVPDDRARAGGKTERRFLSLEFFPVIGYTVIIGGHALLAIPSAGHSGSAEMISVRALERVGRWRAGLERQRNASQWLAGSTTCAPFRTNPAAQESKRTRWSEPTRQRDAPRRSKRTNRNERNPADRTNPAGPMDAWSERNLAAQDPMNPAERTNPARRRTQRSDEPQQANAPGAANEPSATNEPKERRKPSEPSGAKEPDGAGIRTNPAALQSRRTQRTKRTHRTGGSVERVNPRGEIQAKPAGKEWGGCWQPPRGEEAKAYRCATAAVVRLTSRGDHRARRSPPSPSGRDRAAARTRCAGAVSCRPENSQHEVAPRCRDPFRYPRRRNLLRCRSTARTRRGADAGGSGRPPSRACR